MNEDKIREVFSDEEFVRSLLALETPEDVQKALKKKDIELSVDEICKIAELAEKRANGDLSDEELENVAGGMGVVSALAIFGITKALAVAGAATHMATDGRW